MAEDTVQQPEFAPGEKYMVYLANGQVFLGTCQADDGQALTLEGASLVNFENIENLILFGALKTSWYEGLVRIKHHYIVTSNPWKHKLPEPAPNLSEKEEDTK